jgi:hypothetical protein
MMTRKQFQKISSGGLFARRNNGVVWHLDHYLDRYHEEARAGHHSPERLQKLINLAGMVASLCDLYVSHLKAKKRHSPREKGIKTLWADATNEVQELRCRVQAGKTGWQKVKQDVHRIFDRTGAKPHANLKPLSEGYWLEAMDPSHRVGHNLTTPFEQWKASGASQDFFTWLDTVWIPTNNAQLAAVNTERVLYLDTEQKRQAYEVQINGGNFTWASAGDPFRTNDMHTVFSGDGVAIYVFSADEKFYTANHEKGAFHHSSFLGGKPVICAGEWAVEEGRGLVMVSPKTGHYLAGEPEFRRLLFVLHKRGVNLGMAAALWPWHRFQDPHYYNAFDLLRAEEVKALDEPKTNGQPLPEINKPATPLPMGSGGSNPYSKSP